MDSNKKSDKSPPKHQEQTSKHTSKGGSNGSTPDESVEGQGHFVSTPWNPEMIGFQWDFKQKWPTTRAERLRELGILSIHYETTLQRDNIIAAKAWHAQFPPEQTVPDKEVIFQNGCIVKESELSDEGGVIWEEGPLEDVFMAGHGAGSS